jgi:hypothetical protein
MSNVIFMIAGYAYNTMYKIRNQKNQIMSLWYNVNLKFLKTGYSFFVKESKHKMRLTFTNT